MTRIILIQLKSRAFGTRVVYNHMHEKRRSYDVSRTSTQWNRNFRRRGTIGEREALDTQKLETEAGNATSDWSELLRLKGSASDLPADIAAEHDHYLYGTPKRPSF